MGFEETEIGVIPSHWNVATIEEIGEVIGGGTPATKKEEYYGGQISWITPKDLSGYLKKRISKGERSITKEGLENSSAKLMPKNTVLLSSRAPIGYVAIADNEMSTNQGFKSVICNEEKIIPDYLYYVFKTSKESLEAISSGSTFKEVSGRAVKGFKIALPPLREQESITRLLSILDSKIELNQDSILTLEQLAQALFKRWFVDFEFPNENGEPYKSSGGEMVESELGMIPKGWEIKELQEISREPIVCGKTPSTKKKENYGSDLPFITIPDMHGKVFALKTSRYLSKTGVTTQPKKTIPASSICVSCIATPGLVVLTSEPSQTNQQINSVITMEEDVYFIFLTLKNKSEYIRELGSGGSTTLNLNKTQFSKIKVVYPVKNIRKEFHNQIKKSFDLILNLQRENETLKELRDTLLPKLLSGEIELPGDVLVDK